MFQEEVTLTFIFQTIGVILALTALGIYLVKKKAKEVK
jgi:flagellar biogenesis protein FliO